MKQLNRILAIVFFVIAFAATAQVPQAFNYQAVARNSNGTVLANQAIKARFTVREGSSSGVIAFQETKTLSTNQFGLFTHQIGNGDSVYNALLNVNWSSGGKFLQVEIDPAGGSNFTDLGASQLLSVPYALYAANGGGSGTTGPTGATGPAGANGTPGATGPTGPAGTGSVSGTVNYLAKFTPDGTTAGNSIVFDNGSQVLVGTTVVPSATPKFTVNQTGVGAAGYFNIGNSGSSSNALFAQTNGTGFALETGAGNVYLANNVGIGITTPQAKFHVKINDNAGIAAYIENAAAGAKTAYLIFKNSSGPLGGVGYDANNTELGIASPTVDVALRGNSSFLKISNTTNNIGVNTSTPKSTLEVNGTFGGKTIDVVSGATAQANASVVPDAYFLKLQGTVPNAYFNLPNPNTCPGRTYLLMVYFSNDVKISSVGLAGFYDKTGAGSTEISLPLSNRFVQVVSDGTSWIWGRFN